MKQTFEDYLRDTHAKVYTGTDDNMPDAFDNWLTDLQADDFMKYAQWWGDRTAQQAINNCLKEINGQL